MQGFFRVTSNICRGIPNLEIVITSQNTLKETSRSKTVYNRSHDSNQNHVEAALF